uniref:Uncharacterized protein n=1 Tax=Chenopodium quinoa TaxID=63459 RepID=A0A803LJD6_CHEQI
MAILFPDVLKELHFTSPSIEKLVLILSICTDFVGKPYSLDCPNLKILHIGNVLSNNLQLIDVSSVCEVNIIRLLPCSDKCFEILLDKVEDVEVFHWGYKAYMDFICDCSMLWYKLSSPCVMQQPKVSPIVIIRSHVEFLLKSAVILNKLVIICDRKDLQLFVKGHEFMMMELICLPRTSRNARVVFASELRSWESGPPVVIQSLAATDNGLVYSYGLLCRFGSLPISQSIIAYHMEKQEYGLLTFC